MIFSGCKIYGNLGREALWEVLRKRVSLCPAWQVAGIPDHSVRPAGGSELSPAGA